MFARVGMLRALNRRVRRAGICRAAPSWRAILASASSSAPIRAQELPSSPDVQPIEIGSGLPFLGSAGGKLGRVLGRHVLRTSEYA